MARRTGLKWRINEILSLQREYELLEWNIQEIAVKHERTIEAILFKLYNENIIDEFHVARGYPEFAGDCEYDTVNTVQEDEDECYQPDIVDPYISSDTHTHENMALSQLENRVTAMEDTLNDVKYIITKLLKGTTIKKNKKLRKGEKFCDSLY